MSWADAMVRADGLQTDEIYTEGSVCTSGNMLEGNINAVF